MAARGGERWSGWRRGKVVPGRTRAEGLRRRALPRRGPGPWPLFERGMGGGKSHLSPPMRQTNRSASRTLTANSIPNLSDFGRWDTLRRPRTNVFRFSNSRFSLFRIAPVFFRTLPWQVTQCVGRQSPVSSREAPRASRDSSGGGLPIHHEKDVTRRDRQARISNGAFGAIVPISKTSRSRLSSGKDRRASCWSRESSIARLGLISGRRPEPCCGVAPPHLLERRLR